MSEESLSKKNHDTAIFRAKKTEGKLCLQEEEEEFGLAHAASAMPCQLLLHHEFSPNLAS